MLTDIILVIMETNIITVVNIDILIIITVFFIFLKAYP